MACQLVFRQATRSIPRLRRGWHTPDPSPTRACEGLPGCGRAGEWVEEPTPAPSGEEALHAAWLQTQRPRLISMAPQPQISLPGDEAAVDLSQQNFSDTECTPKCNNLGECRGLCNNLDLGQCRGLCKNLGERCGLGRQSFVMSVIPKADLGREQTPSPRLSYCSLKSPLGRSVPAPPEAVRERRLSPRRLSHSASADSQSTVTAAPQRLVSAIVTGPLPSAGSAGHPMTCKGPCKYFWKARGCKDGNRCNRCHLCEWRKH